jgi:hypothetical protein
VRTNLRETALGGGAEPVENGARDRELENAVAEELEPLVRRGAVLDPRGVRKDLREALRGELGDQPAELVRPGFDGALPRRAQLSPDAR